MHILLIRHTTPLVETGTCYGQTNIDVCNSFMDEVEEIKKILPKFNPDYIFTSPLIRCTKLSKTLYPNQAIIEDDRLMETNFGEWEGKKWDDIPREELDQWGNDFINTSPPNGESFQKMRNRITDFWEDKIDTLNDDMKIIIVTHAGVIRSLLSTHMAIPAAKIFNWEIGYGAVFQFKQHNKSEVFLKVLKG